MLEALQIIETMIGLGFYTNEDELIKITDPLIDLLDGSLDFYDQEEEANFIRLRAESGTNEVPIFRDKTQNAKRYKKTFDNEAIMSIKNKIVDICSRIFDI